MEFTVTAVVLSLILSAASGEPVERGELLDTLARRDVVFLGEEHQSDVCHRLQLEVLKGLHQRRPDLVISMEMFERDVQGVLDDYLRGRIDEDTFREHARPWPNYERHYRPIIEFARAEGLDVIAANAPRPLARKASHGAFDSVSDHPDLAREVFTEERAYRELFFEAMGDHGGVDSDDKTANFYLAQCVKDDTMAESMVEYRRLRPHRRPLIVHLCGRFHSDYGRGTVSRLLRRQPLWLVGVLSTISTEDVEAYEPTKDDRALAHYLMVVREEKKEKPHAEGEPDSPMPVADAASEAMPAGAAASAEAAAPRSPASISLSYWAPLDSDREAVRAALDELEAKVLELDGVEMVTARFSDDPTELDRTDKSGCFGEVLLNLGSPTSLETAFDTLQAWCADRFAPARVKLTRTPPLSPKPTPTAPDPAATLTSPREPTAPASPPISAEAVPADAPPARPALGIMPDYGAADPGVTVDTVRQNGPAATAGITDGDRIVGLDGEKIQSLQDYMDVMEGLAPGDVVQVILIRAGERHTLKLKLGKSHR